MNFTDALRRFDFPSATVVSISALLADIDAKLFAGDYDSSDKGWWLALRTRTTEKLLRLEEANVVRAATDALDNLGRLEDKSTDPP